MYFGTSYFGGVKLFETDYSIPGYVHLELEVQKLDRLITNLEVYISINYYRIDIGLKHTFISPCSMD